MSENPIYDGTKLRSYGDPDMDHEPITQLVYKRMMKSIKHTVGKAKGTVVIFGTGGDIKKGESFSEMWKNSKQ